MAARRMVQGVGVEADEPEEYDIEVTWGEETYSPIQYNSFRCSGITLRTRNRPGERIEEAHARCMRALRSMSQRQFDEQMSVFLDRVRVAASRARGS